MTICNHRLSLRRTAERDSSLTHFAGPVNDKAKTDRTRDRAARLRDEALNCLTFAVREGEEAHAAELIDEALRLARRARELAGA
jgi:hypothetical protein